MVSGLLIVDKPAGWTSMDVCARLRRALHERRVGHAGTLDPMATGVLPVFVGRATRAVEFAAQGDKEYVAALRLGVVTNTQDITGQVLEKRAVDVDAPQLRSVLEQFTGEILQVPPMYSAVKIGGKKLYELARKGREVERPPRRVTIHTLELLPGPPFLWPEEADTVYLRVVCSKGTYVRTLCHDIGAALGCGGCMSALRRTRCAGFGLDSAVTLEQLLSLDEPASALLPVDCCFSQYPAAAVSPQALVRAKNGASFPCPCGDGIYRFYDAAGAFLLLGRCQGGQVTAIKSFFEV